MISLGCLLLLVTILWCTAWAEEWLKEEIEYKPLSYSEILVVAESLESEFGDSVVKVTNVLDQKVVPPWTEFKCYNDLHEAEERCVSPLIRLTAFDSSSGSSPDDRPGIILSGTVHGDERLGAVVVTELARLLCQWNRNGNFYAKWLLANRDIWILPFANALGYARNERTEASIDPNRDFPYMNAKCFQTNTAAIIDYVVHQKIFLAGITFHGGMRSLTYAWGSPNHAQNNGTKELSREAPDYRAHFTLARAMQIAAGAIPATDRYETDANLQNVAKMQSIDANETVPESLRTQMDPEGKASDLPLRFFYPIAATTDLVYSVKGGLEDWSYAGGWELSPNATGSCPRSRVVSPWNNSSIDPHLNFLFFLAEADDQKNPPETTYGSSREMRAPSPMNGHIPRNMNMALKLTEMLRPELIFFVDTISNNSSNGISTNTTVYTTDHTVRRITISEFGVMNSILKLWLDTNGVLEVQSHTLPRKIRLLIFPVGCSELNYFEVRIGDFRVLSHNSTMHCTSLTGWDNFSVEPIEAILQVPAFTQGPIKILAIFDQQWQQQTNPDPPVPPQNHISRIRLDDNYSVPGWFRGFVQGGKIHTFPRAVNNPIQLKPTKVEHKETNVSARVDLPMTLGDFTAFRQRLKHQNYIGVVSLVCTGLQSTGAIPGSICGMKCLDCSTLRVAGRNITLKIYETRSYWHSHKKDPRKRLQHKLELATIPLETRNYSVKLPESINSLKGRLLQVVHQDDNKARIIAQDVFKLTEWTANNTVTSEPDDPFAHGLMDRYTMVCLFPPGPSLHFRSPARDRYRLRLMESFPDGITNSVPTDHLMASMGYFLMTTSGNERRVTGHLCAPGLPTDRPAHLQSRGKRCSVSFLAHTQPRTMLNPFASRVLVIKAVLEETDHLSNPISCRPGDEFTVKYQLTPTQEVVHSCRLAWLRLGDRHEHDFERQAAEKEISKFLRDSICSRSVVLPPPAARKFSWIQKGFLGLVYLCVMSLSLANIPFLSLCCYHIRWSFTSKNPLNGKAMKKRYRTLGATATRRTLSDSQIIEVTSARKFREEPKIAIIHSPTNESPDPRQRRALSHSPN